MNMKHFKKLKYGIDFMPYLRRYMTKFYKILRHYQIENYGANKLPDSGMTLPEKYQKFHKVLDEFCDRKGDNQFHGADAPDAVDFKVFSHVNRVYHTFTIKSLLKSRSDERFRLWYKTMETLCDARPLF